MYADDNDPRPVAPIEPELGECCGNGCSPCVFDRYDAALDRYRARLTAWLLRHPGEPED